MPRQGPHEVRLIALSGIPLVQRGDDLAEVVARAVSDNGLRLEDGDALVVAQKIVSKAEGRQVRLADVQPSPPALELAAATGKDPRIVELVLSESEEVLRFRRDVLVVAHRLGFVMASAGVDQSNIADGDETALLLPLDPDASCRRLRAALRERCGVDVAVVVNDSHGRAWRKGVVGVSVGVAGMPALLDRRGEVDLFGRKLRITEVALADELAAAASMVMGQAGEARPVVLCRGLPRSPSDGRSRDLVRPRELDLFR